MRTTPRTTATANSSPVKSTRSSSAPRRSTRERRSAESIYDDAAKQQREEKLRRSTSPRKARVQIVGGSGGRSSGRGKRKPAPDSDEEADDDDDAVPSEDDDDARSSSDEESEEEESDDDDFEASAAKSKRRKKVTPDKKSKKTKVATGRSPKPSAKRTNPGRPAARRTAKTAAQRAAHQALATLARNVLPAGETPGLSSLVAGLLHSYRPSGREEDMGDIPRLSEYTPNLVALARKVVRVHNDRPNRAQLALLNLLFRSVGGSRDTDLSLGLLNGDEEKKKRRGADDDSDAEMEEEDEDEEVILDEMDTDEWARVVTDLVDDMRHVPANQILVCADPRGAVHQASELAERERRAKEAKQDGKVVNENKDDAKRPVSVGATEYRKIYGEFWYVLGHVALTEGGMATTGGGDFESQEGDDDEEEKEESIVRLDADLIRGVLARIIELSPVGQPDVRAASTLAALSVSHAVLDRSAMLVKKLDVATRQHAAATKNKSPGGGAKKEALKVRMESLKRSVEDLEEIVMGPVVQGLFVHRYRDSNEHIRAMCISSLSRMSLQRPDLFLTDKYLKYFGWMMHDKHPSVREAALQGLLKPFVAVHDTAEGKKRDVGDENLMIEKIDLTALEHVVQKFLARVVDSVMDPVGAVQEAAMSLMLMLLKDGFLDEVSEDSLWDQTNQRCLAEDAPAPVRRDALYFILEQLEAFDDGGENEKAAPNERKRAQQLDAIASYAAHTLTNGDVPLDRIRVKVADLLVKSLREMPEHRGLVTDWGAMLRAIEDDKGATTAHQVTAGDRANVAKQRVLVRMLACAAREEVGSVADADFLNRDADPAALETTNKKAKTRRGAASVGREHEDLSVALLKALPNLLMQFKGDPAIVPELAGLPRFLIPTVFSLPQRKQDYVSLIKNLGEIYLSSSDDRVLDAAAASLVSLCKGDHARVAESKAQLRKVAAELRDRVVELVASDDSTIATSALSAFGDRESDFASVARSKQSKQSRRSARSKRTTTPGSPASDKTSLTDDDTKGTADADAEYSIFLNLKRLRILSKKCDISQFFDDRNGVNQLELLCNFVADALKSRLRACKPVDLRLNEDEETTVAKLIDGPEVLGAIGKSVAEGLELLLCVIAWSTHSVQVNEGLIVGDDDLIMEDEPDDASVEDHAVLRLRSSLVSTLELCFAQFIPSSDELRSNDDGESTTVVQHSEDQRAFSDFVQLAAGRVASDLRTLFPREWADAASPILRAFALEEDGRLIGAYVRFLASKEHLLRENDAAPSAAERKLSRALLLPMGRAVASNWTNGNRREAGVFLRHIGASGPAASDIVSATSRQMKKIDPVRMLESQMASLRQSYESWVDETPELENDFPEEEEMAAFEEEEKAHRESFAKLEGRAAQFSHTLGVFGRFSSAKLGPALRGFVREGIRFGFSNLDDSGEDSLVLGSRLSFLLLLSKYATWAKRDRKHKGEIQEYVDGLEAEMRDHEEFEDVHVDDLECLAVFRRIVGLKVLAVRAEASVASVRSGTSVASARDDASVGSATRSVGSSRSGGGSVMRSGGTSTAMSSRTPATFATSVRTGATSATSARTGASSAASARSGLSIMSGRSGASVASALSRNVSDGDESLDSLGDLPSPASSSGGRSTGGASSRASPAASSRASRSSRRSSALPTLPEGEKEESPRSDEEGSDSGSHFSESPGVSTINSKRSQTQMTFEHSEEESDGSSVGSESPPRPKRSKRRKN